MTLLTGKTTCLTHAVRRQAWVIALVGFVWAVAGNVPSGGAQDPQSAELPLLYRVGEPTVATAFRRVLPDGVLEFTEASGETIELKAAAIVRWGAGRGTGSDPVAVLSGEGVITMSGYADPVVALDDDTATLATLRCGTVKLDRNRIRGLILAPLPESLAGDRMLDEIRDTTAERDTVRLRNGDRLSGAIDRIVDNALQIEVDGRSLSIDLARIAVVAFDARLALRVDPNQAAVAVGLADGSMLWCRGLKMAGQRVRLELAGESDATRDEFAVPVQQIVYLQSGGAGIEYLSSLEPVAFRQVPYLALDWPYRNNRSVMDARLRTLGGDIYLRGVGVHSACRLVYRVPDTANRFRAVVALDGSSGRRGSVVFRVLLASEGTWKESYRSPVVRGGDAPLEVDVDLEAAKGIALAVDYADFGDELDRADWLDARFE